MRVIAPRTLKGKGIKVSLAPTKDPLRGWETPQVDVTIELMPLRFLLPLSIDGELATEMIRAMARDAGRMLRAFILEAFGLEAEND